MDLSMECLISNRLIYTVTLKKSSANAVAVQQQETHKDSGRRTQSKLLVDSTKKGHENPVTPFCFLSSPPPPKKNLIILGLER